MILNKKYLTLFDETLQFLEKQIQYEDFLESFTHAFSSKLPVKEMHLFYLYYDENDFKYFPEREQSMFIKADSNLIKHLKNTEKTMILKDEDLGLINILKKDNAELFNLFNFDIIIPLISIELAGFVLIKSDKNSFRQINMLNEYFKFISNIIIANIKIERDKISKRKNFLKQFRHDRLAITGELAATASHEIKNIHGAVLATLAYFNEKGNISPTELRENIKNLNTSIEQANHIVKSMLSVSQYNEINIEPLDISILADDIINLLVFRVSKNIKVEKSFTKDLIINSSFQLLSQAIINIIINSIEAIGSKKGKIIIKTKIFEIKGSNKSFFQISIKDTGPGFDKIILDNLYAKFKTTKKHGTGLGLYNTLNIIKKIGGELKIESSTEGTETFINLPENVKY